MTNIMPVNGDAERTIRKTLATALLFPGFWDRWIAHGVDASFAAEIRDKVRNAEQWVAAIYARALELEKRAEIDPSGSQPGIKEQQYRLAGLHYDLIQWLFPHAGSMKKHWYELSQRLAGRADQMAKEQIIGAEITVGEGKCRGRIRIPAHAIGCVLLITPIDSTKEELFTYETDFVSMGFATVCFDGPGQGAAYILDGFRTSRARMERFVNRAIDFAVSRFPDQKIFLFGTSSGAAWAIRGSAHPQVAKAVAVSPGLVSDIVLPDYFRERLSYVLESPDELPVPDLEELDRCGPVLLFHGNRDVLVKDQDIYEMYRRLPDGKRLVEYPEEGHCCNHKLTEVRQLSAEWYLEDQP